jgi:hypothetical protein
MNDRLGRMVRTTLTLWLVLAGCASGGKRYQDPDMDFGALRTVAVLPFHNLSRDQLAGERVRDVFANMLLATGAFYVQPNGEVIRGIARTGMPNPTAPSVDDVVKFGKQQEVGAVITGVVREYGEVRSGANSANAIAISAQMIETETGKVVWSGSSTKGGVTLGMRLFGGGGEPLDVVTEKAVRDLIDQLFE